MCVTSRVKVLGEPADVGLSYCLSNVSFKQQGNTALLTLGQVFVGQWRGLFLPPQDRHVSTMHLTTLHIKATDGNKSICYLQYTTWAQR